MSIYTLNFLNYNTIMARFYDPRQGRRDEPFDTRVGKRGRPEYDPRHDSGTSSSDTSDLHPEQKYRTDLRNVNEQDRESVESLNKDEDRVAKYFAAAKSAGKFKQKAAIDENTIEGKTPRTAAQVQGVVLPNMGDTVGTTGSTQYAGKPQPYSGKFTGFGL
jgi:hypothetical protein